MTTTPRRTGGQLVAECLRLHGADTVFTVPGESFLAVLDALYDVRDTVRLIVCRHEAGAANMAEAYGKLTGRPGVVMVTRGPGATQGSVGVHTAFQDSTPMLFLIGQIERDVRDREGFQEIDVRRTFGSLAKWATEIDSARRVPEIIGRAFQTAMAGRPGPVVVGLPEDMLTEAASVALGERYRVVRPSPSANDLERMRALLAAARSPFLIAGGGGWTAETARNVTAFAEANALPIVVSFRCQDYVDNLHPCYAGHLGLGTDPALLARVRAADLLLVVGARLGEITTQGYTLLDVPRPRQQLVHVHPSAEELGRVFQADVPINAGSAEFAAAVRHLDPVDASAWRAERDDAHREYLGTLEPTVHPGSLQMPAVMAMLSERLPDAIVTNGAGNYTGWAHRFWRFRRYRTQVAPTSGAMGYGVPAAIAAKLVEPARPVISMNGDGCFLMGAQELATAVRYGLDPLFLVVNNGMYGTIRMHQEREFPARVHGTDLVNPDFVAYARAFGAHAELVEKTADFEPALERALASGRAALLELRIDPDAITPRTTLGAIRASSLGRGR
jgi:acetolactate synthase-1/2/3 large subunit